MKRFVCPLLAASSLAAVVSVALAATRPRYGGTLRIELAASLSTPDANAQADSAVANSQNQLESLWLDRLVRLDSNGRPRPALATSWEHDARFVRWRFKLRDGVKWHDGSVLTPAEVLSALERMAPDLRLRLEDDVLEIDTGEPNPELLSDLATRDDLAVRRAPAETTNGLPLGTGPFRIAEWQSGRRAALAANEDYWGGRPYLDRIEIDIGRASRDQLLDLELGRADLVQLDPNEARRAQQGGRRVWTSAPINLLALRFDIAKVPDARVREALVRSIDRAAIVRVLLQNYGEAVGGFFPQWLSGYSFLFSTAPDLARARQLTSEVGTPAPLRLGYDAADPLARPIAERIAVNARDVGLTVQVAALSSALQSAAAKVEAIIVRARISGPTLRRGYAQLAREFSITPGTAPDQPEGIFAAEKRALEGFAVVPLVCVPEINGLGPRVRNWRPARWGEWRLEDVWLEAEKP